VSFLRRHTDIFLAQLSVLHVAPEYALQRQLRRLQNLDYRSADLDSPLAMDTVDLLDMPYPSASFDLVICNHVLEHVSDDRRALREIRRVLRPGRYAIIMSPIDERLVRTHEDPAVTTPAERDRIFGQGDHVRRYGRDFSERVAGERFEVRAVRHIDELDERQIAHEGLRRDSELFRADDVFLCRPLGVEGARD
jgi:SAM-dependent methyltransferase